MRNALARVIDDAQVGANVEGFFVIDSVRIVGQVEAVRKAFGTAVHHIHLLAADDELAARYRSRDSTTREFETYAEVRRS